MTSAFVFELLLLAGNKNNHENFDEFEFGPDPFTDYFVIISIDL